MYRAGTWSKATYNLRRGGVTVNVPVVLVPFDKSLYVGLRFISLIYLGIGLYVLLRRWTAPKSTHFYLFCLVSFIFYAFHYTGKLNQFDWIVYWSNVVAELLQPALFLHFVLTFPEVKEQVKRRPWLVPACYVPGVLLLAAHIVTLQLLAPSELLRYNLDRLEMLYLAIFFVGAAGVLWHSYKHASTPILRQQMKWVTRGTILAIAPFTLFYVISVPGRDAGDGADEGLGAVAGLPAADLRLRHLPLPADGRGRDLQARHGVHAGRGLDRGRVLRRHRTGGGAAEPSPAQHRHHRHDRGDRGHGAAVRSGQEVVPGEARPRSSTASVTTTARR